MYSIYLYYYLNHLPVYPSLVKSSYLSGCARLVKQIHHLIFVNFTCILLV